MYYPLLPIPAIMGKLLSCLIWEKNSPGQKISGISGRNGELPGNSLITQVWYEQLLSRGVNNLVMNDDGADLDSVGRNDGVSHSGVGRTG